MLEIKITKLPIETTGRIKISLNPSYNFTMCLFPFDQRQVTLRPPIPVTEGKCHLILGLTERLIYIARQTHVLLEYLET